MNPLSEGLAQQRPHLDHQVDLNNRLIRPACFVRLGPGAVTMGALACNAHHSRDDLGMLKPHIGPLDRCPMNGPARPSRRHLQPCVRLRGRRSLVPWCVARRPNDPRRAVRGTRNGDRARRSRHFQVLNTTWSAGQDEDVRPVTRHADVQRDALHYNRSGTCARVPQVRRRAGSKPEVTGSQDRQPADYWLP